MGVRVIVKKFNVAWEFVGTFWSLVMWSSVDKRVLCVSPYLSSLSHFSFPYFSDSNFLPIHLFLFIHFSSLSHMETPLLLFFLLFLPREANAQPGNLLNLMQSQHDFFLSFFLLLYLKTIWFDLCKISRRKSFPDFYSVKSREYLKRKFLD